ncbi:uncharacterized protein FOBCDRAFT_196854 [Fusarium oxysporum Fo47]|uniref:uncharacterized protein n=1 Tax=Fusarium oxysporum Fo47 TaxID=660027 RepID=UPI002869CEF1|nr:uncharacterized protein FOBCDRAFT_196854 [Fusarium oxysporum Fo47]QKD49417.2 hypothetical protein FOBCDRAFT_196854 [Fusarium oxysporum Fo47]
MVTESVGWNVPEDVLVAYSRRMGVSHIRYFAGPYQLQKDGSSVIIQIDGACRGNGTRSARGGWGAFFGPQSEYNSWGLVPPNAPQTSTYAELYALIGALDTTWGIKSRGETVAHWNFLLEIRQGIDDMILFGGRNMEFKFWHVPRELNETADALANRAFT